MNTKDGSAKGMAGLLKGTFSQWSEDKALRLSAALAYYSVFSIAPLLIIAMGVAGLVFGQQAVQGELENQLKEYVGPQAAEGVQSMVQSAAKPTQGWVATVLGFAMLLLGASGVFGQLKDALNSIWGVQAKAGGVKSFIRERVLSFGMVLVIGFLLLASLLLTTLLAGFSQKLGSVLPLPPFFWGALTFLVSFALVTTLFALIFKVLPDVKVAWRDVWIGAAVTALLFEIGKFALGFYLGKQGSASAYGAATSIILLLLWVYYTSCILFFGAEFTKVCALARGAVIEPKPAAEAVSAAMRAQEGLVPASASVAIAKGGPNEPKREALPRPEPRVLDDVPSRLDQQQPLGALLAVTGVSMVLGLLSRGWAQKTKRPSTQLKEGLYGVTREAGVSLASALHRAKKGLEHKLR